MRSWSIDGSSDAPTAAASDSPCDSVGRRREHPVGDPAGPRHCHPKPKAGKDERVVSLRDLVDATFVADWCERTAGRDQGASLGPADQVIG
jgi:hypothetical protein